MTTSNLRLALRSETRETHARLDTALVDHDLTTLSGLRAYLYVHFLARQHLQKILYGYEFLRDETEKLASLKDDFDILGIEPPTWQTEPRIGNYHTLGIIYVLSGSALGSKLLYKNWRAATDSNVLKAKNFMTCAKDSQIWSDFLTYVNITRFNQTEIDEIIDSANYCFGVFEAANNQMLEIL